MAVGTMTVTIYGRGPRGPGRGAGVKILRGKIVLSANSAFRTSAIERYFRKCDDIQFNMRSGLVMNWMRSATRGQGVAQLYGLSETSTKVMHNSTLYGAACKANLSGTFTAFGL